MRPAVIALLLLSFVASADEGDRLREKLTAGEPATLVFLGDSVTGGMHVDDPGRFAFPALVAAMIRERFPAADLTVRTYGLAGAPSEQGLRITEQFLTEMHPDLVVIQYGGNDKGVGDGLDFLPVYRDNLTRLVTALRDLGAVPILVTPPMHEPVPDMPYPLAARAVAEELAVPLADVDTALKSIPHDARGLFPYFMHPREHEHAIMAETIYAAFCRAIGRPLRLSVRLPDTVTETRLGSVAELPVVVRNEADAAREVALISDELPGPLELREVPAGGEATWTVKLPIAHTLSGGRAVEWPVRIAAEAGGEMAFDHARITISPVLNVPPAPAAAPVVRLDSPHLVAGGGMRTGAPDISAELWLEASEDALRLRVDVTDDRLSAGGPPTGDGVELFLDLRDDGDRGRPTFGDRCATLFLNADGGRLRTLDEDRPPAELLELAPTASPLPGGYRLELELPRPLLDRIAGRRVTRLGFDLAVDDNDGGNRESQLMWLGRHDNFVNPRRLGELNLGEPAPPETVRVTVF